MPSCRFCYSFYPREQFIHGNGPRKDVCVRCGLDKGMVTEDEVPSYFSEGVANSRLNLIARRYSPFFWLAALWTAWIIYLRPLELWGLFSLIILALLTLATPIGFILSSAKFEATLKKMTPDYERPPGH